jgi:hypothetical protein
MNANGVAWCWRLSWPLLGVGIAIAVIWRNLWPIWPIGSLLMGLGCVFYGIAELDDPDRVRLQEREGILRINLTRRLPGSNDPLSTTALRFHAVAMMFGGSVFLVFAVVGLLSGG